MKRARNDKAKGDRRQDILACAEQIIQEEGLDSLSIALVAKKARLAVGTIYLYFPKKEDIIAHLTIKSREMLLQKFAESTEGATNALEKIHNILLAYLLFYKQYPFYHQLVSFYETNAGLEEPEELLVASQRITDFVIEVLREGKFQKLIKDDLNETEYSFLLWATAVGVIQLINVKAAVLSKQLEKDADSFYKSYITMIVSSLKK